MTTAHLVHSDWQKIILPEIKKQYMQKLRIFIADQQKNNEVFPPSKQVFSAFNETSFADTKVIIIGQDPYHGKNQGHGMAFSVQPQITIPPSLKNIFKELATDLNIKPTNGHLIAWAKQGVLLLNTVLTVNSGQANSHKDKGWETFTNYIIEQLSQQKNHLVFILWGADAGKKSQLIDENKHCILRSAHPSPLAAYRGFFGSRPFSRTNQYLIKNSIKPINWNL